MGGIHQSMQAGITQGDIHIIIIDPRLAPFVVHDLPKRVGQAF